MSLLLVVRALFFLSLSACATKLKRSGSSVNLAAPVSASKDRNVVPSLETIVLEEAFAYTADFLLFGNQDCKEGTISCARTTKRGTSYSTKSRYGSDIPLGNRGSLDLIKATVCAGGFDLKGKGAPSKILEDIKVGQSKKMQCIFFLILERFDDPMIIRSLRKYQKTLFKVFDAQEKLDNVVDLRRKFSESAEKLKVRLSDLSKMGSTCPGGEASNVVTIKKSLGHIEKQLSMYNDLMVSLENELEMIRTEISNIECVHRVATILRGYGRVWREISKRIENTNVDMIGDIQAFLIALMHLDVFITNYSSCKFDKQKEAFDGTLRLYRLTEDSFANNVKLFTLDLKVKKYLPLFSKQDLITFTKLARIYVDDRERLNEIISKLEGFKEELLIDDLIDLVHYDGKSGNIDISDEFKTYLKKESAPNNDFIDSHLKKWFPKINTNDKKLKNAFKDAFLGVQEALHVCLFSSISCMKVSYNLLDFVEKSTPELEYAELLKNHLGKNGCLWDMIDFTNNVANQIVQNATAEKPFYGVFDTLALLFDVNDVTLTSIHKRYTHLYRRISKISETDPDFKSLIDSIGNNKHFLQCCKDRREKPCVGCGSPVGIVLGALNIYPCTFLKCHLVLINVLKSIKTLDTYINPDDYKSIVDLMNSTEQFGHLMDDYQLPYTMLNSLMHLSGIVEFGLQPSRAGLPENLAQSPANIVNTEIQVLVENSIKHCLNVILSKEDLDYKSGSEDVLFEKLDAEVGYSPKKSGKIPPDSKFADFFLFERCMIVVSYSDPQKKTIMHYWPISYLSIANDGIRPAASDVKSSSYSILYGDTKRVFAKFKAGVKDCSSIKKCMTSLEGKISDNKKAGIKSIITRPCTECLVGKNVRFVGSDGGMSEATIYPSNDDNSIPDGFYGICLTVKDQQWYSQLFSNKDICDSSEESAFPLESISMALSSSLQDLSERGIKIQVKLLRYGCLGSPLTHRSVDVVLYPGFVWCLYKKVDFHGFYMNFGFTTTSSDFDK